MKPILFNTEMVRAILDGRKTCTRRVVKKDKVDAVLSSPARIENPDIPDDRFIKCLCTAPCEIGDILYVRETWAPMYPDETSMIVCGYMYKADDCGLRGEVYQKWYDAKYPNGKDWCWPGKWRPSIHMPKEAARLFLRVTDVRVERLRPMGLEDFETEGLNTIAGFWAATEAFADLWDTTFKPADLPLYGWEANPWVWVIEFERCEKPEEARHEKV